MAAIRELLLASWLGNMRIVLLMAENKEQRLGVRLHAEVCMFIYVLHIVRAGECAHSVLVLDGLFKRCYHSVPVLMGLQLVLCILTCVLHMIPNIDLALS